MRFTLAIGPRRKAHSVKDRDVSKARPLGRRSDTPRAGSAANQLGVAQCLLEAYPPLTRPV